MHRFYLPPEHCAGETLRLDGREAHHALHVLRLKHGELVTVLDGIGNEFLCTVESCGAQRRHAFRVAEEFHARAALRHHFARGRAQGQNHREHHPESRRTRRAPRRAAADRARGDALDDEGAEHKHEKWRQTAIEAIKQCGARVAAED